MQFRQLSFHFVLMVLKNGIIRIALPQESKYLQYGRIVLTSEARISNSRISVSETHFVEVQIEASTAVQWICCDQTCGVIARPLHPYDRLGELA